MRKLFIILTVVFFLTACGEKKIDTSSSEAFQTSLSEISNSLSKEDKTKFENAFMEIAFDSVSEGLKNGRDQEEILKKRVNGKTAAEIIEAANKINK